MVHDYCIAKCKKFSTCDRLSLMALWAFFLDSKYYINSNHVRLLHILHMMHDSKINVHLMGLPQLNSSKIGLDNFSQLLKQIIQHYVSCLSNRQFWG